MDVLTDDDFLLVLQYLSVKELLQCRAVCRRWRDLALHPDLWRWRKLTCYPRDISDADEISAVLRLAPCLSYVYLTSSNLPLVGQIAATTNCAVSRLHLHLSHQDAVLGALVYRNQRLLGGIKKLKLSLETEDGRAFEELRHMVNSTDGLEELKIDFYDGGRSVRSAVHARAIPDAPVSSSLKILDYARSQTLPELLFLLQSHAQTLEKVRMSRTMNPSPALIHLTTVPRLQELECPVTKDLHLLLQCPSLRSLFLILVEEVNPVALSSAKSLLRAATELTSFRLFYYLNHKEHGTELLMALASSGRSKLQEVALDFCPAVNSFEIDVPGVEAPILQLPHLATAFLRNLPHLTRIILDCRISDEVLLTLTPEVAPNLILLQGDSYMVGCLHEWMHEGPLSTLLRVNPRLHVRSHNYFICRRFDEPVCEFCIKPCHVFKETSYVGFSGHLESSNSCTFEKHRDAYDEHWILWPEPMTEVICEK